MGLSIFLILLFFAMGLPIAFAIGLGSLLSLFFMDISFMTLVKQMYTGIDSYPIVAVPLYILAGELMATGGVTTRLIDFAALLLGSLRGSLAQICVATSMFFGGVTGSSIADTAAVGSVMIPGMLYKKYPKGFTAALQACAGSMGPVIPPSIPMVIYGMMTGTSIGQLFIGGVVPGVMMGVSLGIVAYVLTVRRGFQDKGKRPSFMEILRITKKAFLVLMTPVIIVGGILSGIFTATESGVIAVVYALFLGAVVHRELTLKAVWNAVVQTATLTGIVVFIVSTAMLFTWILTLNEVPQKAVQFLMQFTSSKWVILLILNVVLLIAGCLIDTLSALIVFTPLFFPVCAAYGVNPLHLGLIIVVNLTIGCCTPPFGVNLFVVMGMTRITMEEMFHDLYIFLVPLIIVLFIMTYIPITVLFLPGLFWK